MILRCMVIIFRVAYWSVIEVTVTACCQAESTMLQFRQSSALAWVLIKLHRRLPYLANRMETGIGAGIIYPAADARSVCDATPSQHIDLG